MPAVEPLGWPGGFKVVTPVWGNRLLRVSFCPEIGCNDERIDLLALPPGTLIAAPMKFPMMQTAHRNGEAVTDLASHRSLLGEFDVVGVRRGTAADEAGPGGNKPEVITVALRDGLCEDGHGLNGQGNV